MAFQVGETELSSLTKIAFNVTVENFVLWVVFRWEPYSARVWTPELGHEDRVFRVELVADLLERFQKLIIK